MKEKVIFIYLMCMPVLAFGAPIDDFYNQMQGAWYGEGYNVHFGSYKATFSTETNVNPGIAAKGQLKITSTEDESRVLVYNLKLRTFSHTFGAGSLMEVQSDVAQTITANAVYDEESNTYSGWQLIQEENGDEYLSGLSIVLEGETMTFGFKSSETYCLKEAAFCISDIYSPFILKEILVDIN